MISGTPTAPGSFSVGLSATNAGGTGTATLALTIAKASSTTTVSCPASVTYTGAAQTPCTATVTGAGTFISQMDSHRLTQAQAAPLINAANAVITRVAVDAGPSPADARVWTADRFSPRARRSALEHSRFRRSLGLLAAFPTALELVYGTNPVSFRIFLRFRPASS